MSISIKTPVTDTSVQLSVLFNPCADNTVYGAPTDAFSLRRLKAVTFTMTINTTVTDTTLRNEMVKFEVQAVSLHSQTEGAISNLNANPGDWGWILADNVVKNIKIIELDLSSDGLTFTGMLLGIPRIEEISEESKTDYDYYRYDSTSISTSS